MFIRLTDVKNEQIILQVSPANIFTRRKISVVGDFFVNTDLPPSYGMIIKREGKLERF